MRRLTVAMTASLHSQNSHDCNCICLCEDASGSDGVTIAGWLRAVLSFQYFSTPGVGSPNE